MPDSSDASPLAVQPKTVSHQLGEIVWLMTQSPLHRHLFISDLEWYCLAPVLLEQYRIYPGEKTPAAAAFWAFVSEETEARLISGAHRLRPEEWRGGDRPWLIEVLAPWGGQDEILQDLHSTVFGGKSFKMHRFTDDGKRVVQSYEG